MPCLCRRLISSLTDIEFYNSSIVFLGINLTLWWNYMSLVVYFLVSVEYFSMITSFELSRSFIGLSRRKKKAGMISVPEKHILFPRFLFLPLSSSHPFSLSGFLGIICWNSCFEEKGKLYCCLFFFLPCIEENAIKRESARLSVFIPSQRRFPSC